MKVDVIDAGRVLDGAAPAGADPTGVVVVRVSGELDLYTAPELREVLEDLLPPLDAPVRGVVVDLTGVTFVDSYSLGVLVHGHRLARQSGRAYALAATHEHVHGLFSVTGLSRVLPLHPDASTALRHLHPEGRR